MPASICAHNGPLITPVARITLFVEVLNALNRTNLTAANGFIRRGTGEAVGYTEPLLPRLPSAGIRIDF